jgi:hypothetical protein
MHEIQSFERVVLLDSPVKMDTAFFASVTEDRDAGVENVEFASIGSDGEVGAGDDGDDGEERTGGFVTLRAAAGVVVEDVGGEGYFYFVVWAVAMQFPTGEVLGALREAIID